MLSFLGKGQQRKVILSSYLGSTIEFYDLILYATASAVVFGPVFFSTMDPRTATVASLATFATAYLARPIGGIVFGHFGDRIGRKKMLMISMAMMGIASFLVGIVPAIPVWSALMLITLRVIQGIAIGGEWGGAALMSLEHADDHNRGLAASFTNAGGPSGAFLGTAALALAAFLAENFSTTSRYTGASLGYQLASLLGAGFTPVIAASIFAAQQGSLVGVIAFLMGGCALSIVVLAFFAKESRHRDLTTV